MASGFYTGKDVDEDLASEEGTPVEPYDDNTPLTRGAAKRKEKGKTDEDDPDPKKRKHQHLPSTSASRGTQAGLGKTELAIRMLEQIQKTQDIMREESKANYAALSNRLKSMEETLTRIQQDCNTRMGVLEARVTALQIARRDQAVETLTARPWNHLLP